MAKRFEKYQIDLLEAGFEESEHLTKEKKIYLRRVTGLDMEQIASWFRRKRAWKRAKESRGELERIQNELQQNKNREAELEEENRHLKHWLTIIICGLIICFIMAIFKKVTFDDYGTILEYINFVDLDPCSPELTRLDPEAH
ncbi:hypothetical protein CDL12_01730 [Handroanthus impetiginosus]|uniref:Homeobox-leucine zipper protein n=1 Tax=Handroanthus impetiginosus TaxID=429701 RepID=A0A2G9I6Z2_9LAMI|nr:hypothetical protein CDL12_01730 [Handroanthus impetiginosus]